VPSRSDSQDYSRPARPDDRYGTSRRKSDAYDDWGDDASYSKRTRQDQPAPDRDRPAATPRPPAREPRSTQPDRYEPPRSDRKPTPPPRNARPNLYQDNWDDEDDWL
jgi:molecular chaperone DnaK